MAEEYEIVSKRFTRKSGRLTYRNLVVFTFFLFLSFIFWYLNSLGKELETDIKYPVRYINLPKEKVFAEDLPSKLNLNLKGPGYSIFKLKHTGNRAPAVIDISKVNYKRIHGTIDPGYYLVTSGLLKNLTTQLRTECKIISIKPDTLFFSFEQAVSK